MVPYYGDFAEDATVLIPFNTFSSNDPTASVTVTDLADADIKVHKDGSTTEIATDGASVAINFDTVTGNHMITIDTSAHADYSTGSEYAVRLEGITVDAGTINAWVGAFSIERAGGVLAILKAGTTKVDVNTIKTQTVTCAAGVTVLASVGTAATSTAQTGDTYALANGAAGFVAIDTVVDSILEDTGTTIPGLIADLDTVVDRVEADTQDIQSKIGTPTGVSVSADIVAVKSDTGNILTDTAELQTNQGNWATATGFSTHSAADVKTAMEANNSDLDYLVTDLINRKSIKIATGVATQYTDAGVSLGAVAAGYGDDGVDVSRPRQVIVKV